MSAEYDVRSKYLTFALEARRVVDLLLPFVERGEKAPALVPSLNGLMESLESSGSAETVLARLRTPGPRPVYEELLTNEDLESPEERTRLTLELRKVVLEQGSLENQMASARQAILLLCAVEGRALNQFSQLTERSQALSLTV